MALPSRRRGSGSRKPVLPKIMLIISLVALIAVFAFIFWPERQNTDVPQQTQSGSISLELSGDERIVLEYGSSFDDPGAVGAWHEGEESYPLEVKVDSDVDLTRLGEYTITYSAERDGKRVQKIRKVIVVDTQKPIIELIADPDGFTAPGKVYQEEGFTATDNYDGDITDKVQRIPSEDGTVVVYRVSDSSGNMAEVTRTIVYSDRVAPVLTLKGETTITITAGGSWSEPGYQAIDDVDGDLTSKVSISGKVDPRSAGTYTLTYTVSDSSGNTTKVERTIIVKAVEMPDIVQPNGKGKVIYLTFDDGPGAHTERLLGILRKYDVKATFFVCKTGYMDLLDDIARDGHTIGIHSKTHKYSQIYSSPDAFFSDFYAMRDLIKQYAGVEATVSRFPGGSSNRVSIQYCSGIMTHLTKALKDLGYRYFDWNIDSNDAGGTKTADGVFRNVTKGISSSKSESLVVLQHDIHGYSVDAVERIILWGLDNGYTFSALDLSSPSCEHAVRN